MTRKPVYLRSDVLKIGLSSEGIFSYVALSIMQNKADVIYLTPQIIWLTMCGADVPLTRDLKEKVVAGLMELNEYRIISIKTIGANLYEINTSKLSFDTDHIFYEYIYAEEIRKMCRCQGKINKFELVKYFLVILSSFENKIKIMVNGCEKKRVATCHPLNLYQKLTGLSRPTILKYNAVLEETQVLFVLSSPTAHTMNYYCRYENKDAILDYLKTNNLLSKD